MKTLPTVVKAVLVSLLSLGLADGVVAKDKSEHDAVREALRRGEALPLDKILAIARQQVHGDVIEVDIEHEKGVLVYQIKVLTDSGRVREIYLDARTGAVLKIEDD